MTSLTKGIIFSIMLLLLGFTIIQDELSPETEPVVNVQINEHEYSTPDSATTEIEKQSIIKFVEKGDMLASWYGPRFHGKKTANGEYYDQMAFTAAHKTLPFGTLLKLTNPRNNKTVIVRVNDRGPYSGNRDLDLSKGAAVALGMVRRGVIKVEVAEVALADENRPLLAIN